MFAPTLAHGVGLAVLALNLAASVYLLVEVWRTPASTIHRIGCSVLLLVPVSGLLAYLWITRAPGPQPAQLRNDLPRGFYADRWTAMQPWYKARIDEMERKDAEE